MRVDQTKSRSKEQVDILNEGRRLFIGIDVGGTNIKAAIISDDGGILHHTITDNNASQTCVFNTIKKVIKKLILFSQSNHWSDIQAIGIAVPGRVNRKEGVVIRASNLNWTLFPLKQKNSRRVSIGDCHNE